jgi:hypothetical protein
MEPLYKTNTFIIFHTQLQEHIPMVSSYISKTYANIYIGNDLFDSTSITHIPQEFITF